jgi:hypothetical protein
MVGAALMDLGDLVLAAGRRVGGGDVLEGYDSEEPEVEVLMPGGIPVVQLSDRS